MKTIIRGFFFAVCPLLIVAVILAAGAGCEKLNSDGTHFLRIDPPTVLMGTNLTWVTLTVVGGTRELSLPLTWSTDNDGIGHILPPTAGLSAIYARSPINAMNVVTVRDQYGAEGYAHINQVDYSTPAPTSGTSVTSAVTNATANITL